MKKAIVYLCFLLTYALLLCSCAQRASYDEDGICRVIDGEVPEERDAFYRMPFYYDGYTSFEEYLAKHQNETYLENYIIFRATRKTAESIAYKDLPFGYTVAEMEIAEVYYLNGQIYSDYTPGTTINLVLQYAFVPEKGVVKIKDFHNTGVYNLQDDSFDGAMFDLAYTFDYVDDDSEYLIFLDGMLLQDIQDGKKEIRAYFGNTPAIISKDNVHDVFLPHFIWKIDQEKYEEMKQDEQFSAPETREIRILREFYEYVYFDILDQYIFGEK